MRSLSDSERRGGERLRLLEGPDGGGERERDLWSAMSCDVEVGSLEMEIGGRGKQARLRIS